MQSTNEELTTVNEELHNRMAELSQTNDDLHNVLAGIELAIIIVGLDLRIRRYTAAAEKLFHMVPADIGRTIDIIDPFIEPNKLRVKVRSVIETLSTMEEDGPCKQSTLVRAADQSIPDARPLNPGAPSSRCRTSISESERRKS
jgi:hypothetical protein